MTWARRILVGLSGLLLSGCVSGGVAGLDDVAALARSQVPEPADKPADNGKPNLSLPTAPSEQSKLLPTLSPLVPASATVNVQQATALLDGSTVRVRMRAWVNGRPIYEDEVLHSAGPQMQMYQNLRNPQRSEKFAEIFNATLEQMIDQEIMFQDAVKKLEKGNPKALGKLHDMVEEEYDKRVKKLRDIGMPEERIKSFGYVFRRTLERGMIAMQYAQSRIVGFLDSQVTLDTIKDYYDQHPTEFMLKDRVDWQDVFIAVGPKHPTLADARRFAEELVARCRTPDDFAKIQAYDDGESKTRDGAGFGHKIDYDKHGEYIGDIRPHELVPYLLKLKDGQIGPVVEIGTGVHIFRVLKREYGGVKPMDAQVQRLIRGKLKAQLFQREYEQLRRVMRARAVVQIVRDLP